MNEHIIKEMARPKPTIVVSALVEQDSKYLLVRDDKFDFWRPPGGRMNIDEEAEDTLKREMKEELGVDIKIDKTLGFGEDHAYHEKHDYETHRLILYFLCSSEEKITSYDDDERGAEMKWVTKEELLGEKEIEPAFSNMINMFGKNITKR